MGTADDALANLRQQTLEWKKEMLEGECRELMQDIEETKAIALEHMREGDLESARYDDDFIMGREADLQTKLLELQQLSPPELSDAKKEWIARRTDLINPQTTQAADVCHRYITEKMGVQEDSETYFALLGHALEPSNYQPMPTPNDICKELGIDARTYNKGVRELRRRKQAGNYRE